MNPFYFGSRERRLFGIYHPATGRPVRSTGVVICPPLLLESMRSLRLLRQLAEEFSARGFHVLRFDYHGTGDSGGTGEQETLEGWTADVRTAVQELADLTAITRATLLGVRFGAVVATRAASISGPLDDLVLWDPVVAGRRYLRWLLGRAEPHNGAPSPTPEELLDDLGPGNGGEPLGVDGFPMGRRLLQQLATEELNGMTLRNLPIRRVILASSPGGEPSFLLARLQREGVPHFLRTLPDDMAWEDPELQGSIVFAPRTLRELVDCVTTTPD